MLDGKAQDYCLLGYVSVCILYFVYGTAAEQRSVESCHPSLYLLFIWFENNLQVVNLSYFFLTLGRVKASRI